MFLGTTLHSTSFLSSCWPPTYNSHPTEYFQVSIQSLLHTFSFSWSFGVVLWEIFTLGGSPYPGISTDEFLSFLKSKRKMDQPDSCPDEFYKLMLDCWEDEPEMRPIFAKIYERIGNLIEEFADVVSIAFSMHVFAYQY